MNMRQISLAGIFSLFVAVTFVTALAGEPAAPTVEQAPVPASRSLGLAALPETAVAQLSAEDREIRDLLVQEKLDVNRIEARAANLKDPLAVLDLQREISVVKAKTEIAILAVQARHARLAGRTEQATEIDAVVAAMRLRLGQRVAQMEAQR